MNSPLSEIPLAEIFAKPPKELTREDRDRIIQYYRDQRAKFAAAPPKPPKGAPKARADLSLSLQDLGLKNGA